MFFFFSRLAAWNTNNPNKLPEDHLIHLQVSLHSLFHRLYGMYPCNFLSYLRSEYSHRENLGVFSHTIKVCFNIFYFTFFFFLRLGLINLVLYFAANVRYCENASAFSNRFKGYGNDYKQVNFFKCRWR